MKLNRRLPLFRSPEQERLLEELFVFADRPISLSGLASRAGTSIGGAHKEVERLESPGLVQSTPERSHGQTAQTSILTCFTATSSRRKQLDADAHRVANADLFDFLAGVFTD